MTRKKSSFFKSIFVLALLAVSIKFGYNKLNNYLISNNKPTVVQTVEGLINQPKAEKIEEKLNDADFYINGYGVTIPDTLQYYNLTKKQKEVYIRLCKGVSDQKSVISFNNDINEHDLFVAYDVLFNTLYYDCSLKNEYTYNQDSNGNVIKVNLNYYISKDEADRRTKKLKGIVSEVQLKTRGLDDFNKIKYIHDYILKDCQYSNTDKPDEYTAYGALSEHKAVCSGYSQAMSLLCNECGIECYSITGNSKINNEPHRWNVLKCNGEWYHLDATWDDKDNNFSYHYFNVPQRMIEIDHKIDIAAEQNAIVYDITSIKDNYYFKNGMYISEPSHADDVMQVSLMMAVKNKKTSAQVLFDNQNVEDVVIPMYLSGDLITARLKKICNNVANQLGLKGITPVSRSQDGLLFEINFVIQ